MNPADIHPQDYADGDIGLNIIGLRLANVRASPDFYFYVMYVNADLYPLMDDDRILLFRNLRYSEKVLETAPESYKRLGPHEAKSELMIDVPNAIWLAEKEGIDDGAYLLNLLNVFFDAIARLGINLDEYQPSLWAFADHLTTSIDLDIFFSSSGFTRAEICKALYWLIGAFMSHTTTYKKPKLRV